MNHFKTLLIIFPFFLSVNIFAQNTTGINTAAPSSKAALHVKNDALFKQGVIVPDLTAADTSIISPAATDRGLFFYDYPNKQFLYFDGSKWRALAGPTIGAAPTSSGFWSNTGNDIYYNTGNVGIGNSVPIEKLDVNGNIQIPAANEYKYSGAKTHIYAVGNADFNPYYTINAPNWVLTSNDPGQQLWRWAVSGTIATGTTVIATAPVNLPDGSTIIAVECVYGLGTNTQLMELRRLAFTGPTTFPVIASAIGSAGSSQVTVNGLATAGSGEVLNNASYRYWLKWSVPITNTVTPPGSNSALYGVRIRYSVTKAD
ncbi:MAG: hypothetical protein H7329_00240 [Opitutaceae bacterium]|nr:hypothetical protein [Cytophagales bacterium]